MPTQCRENAGSAIRCERSCGVGHFLVSLASRHRDVLTVVFDCDHLGSSAHLTPGRAHAVGELRGDRSDTTYRDIPLPRSLPDHVVQKADVLMQGVLVGVCERTDQPVGENETANHIVVEGVLQNFTEGALDKIRPVGRVDSRSHVLTRHEWSRQ